MAGNSSKTGNRLLERLPSPVLERLLSQLTPVRFQVGQVIYEAGSPIDYVYFPVEGILSTVVIMLDGSAIEAATIGNEGAAGLPFFSSSAVAPNRVICQVAGHGLRMEAVVFEREAQHEDVLRKLLLDYETTFIVQLTQLIACNGLHDIRSRCARWLLMAEDRMSGNEFAITHEFLAQMLGVRRSSVSEVLQTLQGEGLIGAHRGKIAVLNRRGLEEAACECYQAIRSGYDRLLG